MQEMEDDKQKESASGPWKVSNTDTDSEADKPEEEEVTERTPVVTTAQTTSQPTKYVPPHLRNIGTSSQPSMTPSPLAGTRKSKSGAPKIADIVEFPSLGANDLSEDSKGFQTVRHGTSRDTIERNSANVALDNKYGLLTDTSKELQNND